MHVDDHDSVLNKMTDRRDWRMGEEADDCVSVVWVNKKKYKMRKPTWWPVMDPYPSFTLFICFVIHLDQNVSMANIIVKYSDFVLTIIRQNQKCYSRMCVSQIYSLSIFLFFFVNFCQYYS